MMTAGYGPTFSESSRMLHHEWCFSKTCRVSSMGRESVSVAYAAGIIDGEGSITIQRNETRGTPQYALCLAVEMDIGKSSQTLNALAWLFGGRITVNRNPRTEGRHAGTACWRLHGIEAACALDSLRSFLRTKRGQADVVIPLFRRESQRPTMGNGKRNWTPERLEDWRNAYQELSRLNARGDQPHEGFAVFVGDQWMARVPASLFEGAHWETFSGRWPRRGSMRNGICFRLPELAPPTNGNGCSSWPTPDALAQERFNTSPGPAGPRPTLGLAVKLWQTPSTDSFRSRGGDRKDEAGLDRQARFSHRDQQTGTDGASTSQRAVLSPRFVEALMGLPDGMTDCSRAVTESYPSWQEKHFWYLRNVLGWSSESWQIEKQ